MLFLCYSRCSTCKKAQKWLDEQGIAYTQRDIKEDNPTLQELETWHQASALPLKKFFNTSGQLYRALTDATRPHGANDAEYQNALHRPLTEITKAIKLAHQLHVMTAFAPKSLTMCRWKISRRITPALASRSHSRARFLLDTQRGNPLRINNST